MTTVRKQQLRKQQQFSLFVCYNESSFRVLKITTDLQLTYNIIDKDQ